MVKSVYKRTDCAFNAVSFLSVKIKMRLRKLNRKTLCAFYALVPLTGLEPVRYCYRGILSFSV
ncbi:MAG TPA: hypothetical protein PLS20_10090, partial [Ruminococcus flavefaciens]|nr:hypothetical protein [Ruminococcus flavefaciens]